MFRSVRKRKFGLTHSISKTLKHLCIRKMNPLTWKQITQIGENVCIEGNNGYYPYYTNSPCRSVRKTLSSSHWSKEVGEYIIKEKSNW